MRIGTLAARANVTTKTIRYYEEIGLLPLPARTPNGYRCYSERDLTRLQFVRRARAAGLSLQSIHAILDDYNTGIQPCRQVQARAAQQITVIDQRIDELRAIRQGLADLAARAEAVANSDNCDANEVCSAFRLVKD